MNEDLKKLFENVDSKILESEDIQKGLETLVEAKAKTLAESKAQELFEAKEADYQKSLDETIDTVKQAIELDQKEKFNEAVESKVKEISEEYGALVKEEAETKLLEEMTRIEEDTKKYLEVAVKEFLQEAMPKWQQEVDVAKATKLQEEFKTLAEAFDVEIKSIDENEETSKLKESLDKSIEREKDLEIKVNEMVSEKLLSEAKDGLTAPKADKLTTLMESVDFVSETQYKSKLEQFVAVLGDSINESKIKDKQEPKKASWK